MSNTDPTIKPGVNQCAREEYPYKTRATQSVAYPLAKKIDPLTLTFDLENQ